MIIVIFACISSQSRLLTFENGGANWDLAKSPGYSNAINLKCCFCLLIDTKLVCTH